MFKDNSIFFKDIFYSLNLETSLFDDPKPNLEWDRQHIVSTFCDDNRADNWEGILENNTSEEFLADLYYYAKENLIKLHLFISSPFATEFKRSVETPRISFVANIGGMFSKILWREGTNLFSSGLMGLCMGFSFVSLAEIIYYIGQFFAKYIGRKNK